MAQRRVTSWAKCCIAAAMLLLLVTTGEAASPCCPGNLLAPDSLETIDSIASLEQHRDSLEAMESSDSLGQLTRTVSLDSLTARAQQLLNHRRPAFGKAASTLNRQTLEMLCCRSNHLSPFPVN